MVLYGFVLLLSPGRRRFQTFEMVGWPTCQIVDEVSLKHALNSIGSR